MGGVEGALGGAWRAVFHPSSARSATRRPAPAQASAASRAGGVAKIATTCCASVFSPTGTRKNVIAAMKSTAPLMTRFTTSPSTALTLGGPPVRAKFPERA